LHYAPEIALENISNAPVATTRIFWRIAAEGDGSGFSLQSLTCPGWHNKKVVQFGHHFKETVFHSVSHRQFVFSIPKFL